MIFSTNIRNVTLKKKSFKWLLKRYDRKKCKFLPMCTENWIVRENQHFGIELRATVGTRMRV